MNGPFDEEVGEFQLSGPAMQSANLPAKILGMLGLLANVRLAHWQGSTKDNTHKALGDLYDQLDEQLDHFAEVALGHLGKRKFDSCGLSIQANYELEELIEALVDCALSLQMSSKQIGSTDLDNITQEMLGSIFHAKYFLEL